MNVLLTIANWLLPLLYLALMIDYGVTFFLRVRTSGGGGGIVAVVAAHAAFFVLRTVQLGYPPLTNSYEILSFVALSIGAVYWLVERVSRDRRAGAFVFLVAFALQYTASVFLAYRIEQGAALAAIPNVWDQLHVISAVLAYTALILAGVYAVLHLVTERNLRRHQFGQLFDRLPPVDLLGKMIWCALLIGLGFLTVSVVSGPLLFAHPPAGSPPPLWQAKTILRIVLGSLAWVVCLTAVAGKVFRRWPSRVVSAFAVAVFLVILVMLVTSAALA
jgi:ABC-type uncharacterized transport system permease subunit